jgi:amino acid adenylation domain-containing protein
MQESLSTAEPEHHKIYWERRLASGIEEATFPWCRRTSLYSWKGDKIPLVFDAETQAKLQKMTGGSPFLQYAVVVAVLKICLWRYSGNESVAIGSPCYRFPARAAVDAQPNAVTVLDRVDGNVTFRQFITQVRSSLLEAYAHQDYSLDRLINALGLSKIANRGPLFSIIIRHEAIHDPLPELRCDAIVTLSGGPDAVAGQIDYNARLFDPSVVSRVAQHVAAVLREGLADQNQPLSSVEVLTDQERAQLPRAEAAPEAPGIGKLFALQVGRRPDAIAITIGSEQVSYDALDRRANQLARRLRRLGAAPGAQVGIYLRRSPDLIVAVLGVLKAGAACVPMDPSFPDDRLRHIAATAAGLAVVVVDQPMPPGVTLAPETAILSVDAERPSVAAESAAPFDHDATDQMLVYVMYTSGSTGRPKAVALTHGCLRNLVGWQIAEYPAGQTDRTLQFASLGFDVSFQEIFATLCAGGTLVLIAEDARRDPARLIDVTVDGGVSRLFVPYAALRQLAFGGGAADTVLGRLRDIFVAGEQLQITAPVIELLRRHPGCRLHNQYGPTESHVVTAFTLDGIPSRWPRLPPIGRAIANAAIYLTDAGLHAVPSGAPGELCIGGAAMGWGYLGWPEMTALKFVPSPFPGPPGGRLYRTGDMARLLSDGNIEFLGRADDQVKIRGYRLEPGEIEVALARHGAVREAAVLPQDGGHGGHVLVAYVVLNPDRVATVEQLRNHLRGSVPDYAVPSKWIELDSFPLTPSGKIDRRALPSFQGVKELAAESYVAPRSVTEQTLAEMWAAILKRPSVGVREDFFDLGGHSLLAAQLVARIQEKFQVGLSITTFFEARTIEHLAAELLRLQAATADGELVAPLLGTVGRMDNDLTILTIEKAGQ